MPEKIGVHISQAGSSDCERKLEYGISVDQSDRPVKRDKHMLLAVPQPSDHKDDPLNWSSIQKYWIVLLMSAFTLISQLGSALLNPAFVQVARDLHVTVEQASYTTTVFIMFTGIFPLLVTPFANIYGRRILYLIFTIIAIAGYVGSAVSPSWGGVITGRVFSGIGSSIPVGIGAATICDLFVQGKRGVPMGIYAWATLNGPHLAPIAGGYIAQRYGWRWAIWTPAIILGVLFILALFTFPETLFPREGSSNLEERSYIQRLLFYGKVVDRNIRIRDFLLPLYITKYAAITLPCITYMVTVTYGSPLFAVTGSFIGSTVFHFNLEQTGLFLGIPLTVGCFIGELLTGWVSDFIINTYAKHHGGYRKPEARLYVLPLVALTPVGLATFGYCVENHKPWIQAVVCMAISGIGTQVCTTLVYTYCCDSYTPQSSEISVIINLFKSLYAFNIGFYGLPIANKLGFTAGFGVLSAISATVLIFPLFLIFSGENIREWQGYPKKHQDL